MSTIKRYLIVFAVSMLPIVELRGSIPIAASMDISFLQALPFAVVGNLLPVPFIILFFKFFFKLFRTVPVIGHFF